MSKILTFAIIITVCFGVINFGDNLVTSVLSDNQIISFGNPNGNSISFMVLVDDEGAKDYLPKILQIFADNKVEASFFVTGDWTKNNPDLLKSILARGHEIGNYGYDATDPSNLTLAENQTAIDKTNYIIKENLGVTSTLFTPHFGIIEDDVQKAAKNCGNTFVVASLDSLDWGDTSPEKIISQVLYHAKAGSFVTLHPCKETAEALPTMLLELSAKGMGFKSISHNLQ